MVVPNSIPRNAVFINSKFSACANDHYIPGQLNYRNAAKRDTMHSSHDELFHAETHNASYAVIYTRYGTGIAPLIVNLRSPNYREP